jgi:hypothetical protein
MLPDTNNQFSETQNMKCIYMAATFRNKTFKSPFILILMVLFVLSVTGLASSVSAQPSHPTGVTASDDILEQIDLAWDTPSSGMPDSYYLYRSVDNVGCSGIHFATVSGSLNTFTDLSFPSSGVLYYYSLRSVTSQQLSLCSVTASGTAEKLPPPQSPVNFSATTNDFEKVRVTWAPPTSNSQPVVAYNLYRTTVSGERFCLEQHLLVRLNGVMNTLYDDTSAVPGQTYYYSIRSIGQDSGGLDTFSSCPNESSKVGRRPEPPVPQAPGNISATDGTFSDKVNVIWQAPVTGGTITHYNIFRSTGLVSCTGSPLASVTVPNLSYDDFSAVPGVIYNYVVESEGPHGKACGELDPGHARLLSPGLIDATDGTFPDRVNVTWNRPPAGDNIGGYEIYRNNDCSGSPIANVLSGVLAYNDFNVTPGVIYDYSIRTYSTESDVVKSACGPTDPGHASLSSPTNVSATDGTFTNKVDVSWNPPASGSNFGSYRIFRNATCSGQAIANVPANVFLYSDFNVTPGVIYDYSVQLISSLDPTVAPSPCVMDPGHASLGVPSGISATDGTFPDRVNVTWSPPASSSNIGGYELFRNNNCSGSPIATVPSGFLTHSDMNVTPGVIYDYSIRATSANSSVANSACGPTDPGHASLSSPRNVSATDGTFPNKVDISWNPPASGSNFGSYRIFRNATCSGPEIGSVPANIFLYSDFNVTSGVIYDYSIQLISSLHPTVSPSPCVTDPGHASLGAPVGVLATDGDFPDRVQVSWTPNPANGSVGTYQIFRNSSCTGSPIGSVNGSTVIYTDFDVEPGVVYQYSVKAISSIAGIGSSACSIPDPGHASILPPPLQVSTSTTPEGLKPAWTKPPGNITGYELFRSENPNDRCVGSPIATPSAGTLMYVDESVNKGTIYYYSILATSPTGKSACSNAIASILEGQVLLSPAFAKFNTYLGQQNFAELINQGTKDKPVRISIFNLRGELMTELNVLVKAKEQVDININERIQFACNVLQRNCEGFEDLSATVGAPNGLGRPDGIVDTYGLVRFEFDDSDPLEKLVGRMSFYRSNTNGSYSFAFAREFRNPITGNGYGVSNTYDPRGMGFLVPNWAELISFGIRNANGDIDLQPLGYTVNIYDQEGVRKLNRHVVLQPLGEIDIHGGHEFVNAEGKVLEGVYLVEVIPDNPKAEYSLSIARYSSNAPPATDPETYNYAFVAEGNKGSTTPVYAPIGNTIEGVLGLSDKLFADNWVEIACISSLDCEGLIRFVSSTGKETAGQFFKIKSKSQFHFNASALLDPKSTGSVQIVPLTGMIIGQSMTYLHGGENDLQSAFVSPARTAGIKVQSGSINTFLGMQNVLNAFSTANTSTEASYEITSFSGGFFQGVLGLGGESVSSLRISDNSSLNFPSNTYGAMILTTESPTNSINAEVRRVRVLSDGKIDFVMPTLMK